MARQPSYLKMSQIISLSNDYKIHQQNIIKIKAAIDHSNTKRNNKITKLKQEKNRYAQAIRKFNDGGIQRQNQKMVKRIETIRASKAKLQQSVSRMTLKSVRSQKSIKSITSNSRRRTIKERQIKRENQKIAMRIMNPKSFRDMAIERLNKSFKQEQQYVRIRSRFSPRNQDIVKSLALKGLNLKKDNVQFLPQISRREHSKTQLKISPSKQIWKQ